MYNFLKTNYGRRTRSPTLVPSKSVYVNKPFYVHVFSACLFSSVLI